MLFLKNINQDIIKTRVLNCRARQNGVVTTPNASTLSLTDTTIPDTTMLLDPVTGVSVLINKVNISDFVDKDFDIALFQNVDQSTIQLPELNAEEVTKWNNKLGLPVVSVYENNFSNMEGYDMDTLKKYAVFCRLLGFYDLDISEVNISVGDKTMMISVRESSVLYCGYVEIKTW